MPENDNAPQKTRLPTNSPVSIVSLTTTYRDQSRGEMLYRRALTKPYPGQVTDAEQASELSAHETCSASIYAHPAQ